MCARNDGRVVAASDVDCNELAGAISCSDGDAVCVGDTRYKLIVRCIGRIGPGSFSIDTEFSITVATFNSSLDDEAIRAIQIDRSQCARSRQ